MNETTKNTHGSTAEKFDTEKVRLDLLPVIPLIGVGRVLTYGAKKYSERNWEKGLDWSRCYGAALRHLFAWWNGETFDNETQLNHLDHAICELMFLREFAETHPELDDRPNNFTFSELLAKARERETAKSESAPSPNLLADVNPWIDCVKEFNRAYGVEAPTKNRDLIRTQLSLIREEITELIQAFKYWEDVPSTSPRDCDARKEVLDAICDSIYVLIGLALKMGMDLDGAFREVHRSNMSKLDTDGKPIRREDGKILKSPNFTPPNLKPFI